MIYPLCQMFDVFNPRDCEVCDGVGKHVDFWEYEIICTDCDGTGIKKEEVK